MPKSTAIFSQFRNHHKGQDIILIATGPSLDKFTPMKDAVYIGVNGAVKYNKVKFDYL
ncbi:MAG: hypothetical protein FWE50_02610 [Alphaproteobacteria bacterium]|nr:hypothetical protein [Alphaproteobacteria bacterium]